MKYKNSVLKDHDREMIENLEEYFVILNNYYKFDVRTII